MGMGMMKGQYKFISIVRLILLYHSNSVYFPHSIYFTSPNHNLAQFLAKWDCLGNDKYSVSIFIFHSVPKRCRI